MAEKIVDVNTLQQYKDDMQRYAIYSTRHRAIPEYRDGLKPVHRKIVYCMYNNNRCLSEASKTKSADVVGAVMGKYHPHGDSGIYDAIKVMANWFDINIPLIDPHGAFGNFQGDAQAASRYTEVNLSKFAIDCVIGDLKDSKQAVDWVPTYDDKNLEPEFLPATVPLLLINGSFGIAVGIKVEIPRHNINEVIDATIKLMDNPDATIELIPDHCMPCEIIKTNFKAIGNKGFGSYKVRGIVEIGKYSGTKREYNNRDVLIIRSVPDLTFLNSITDKVEDLIESNTIVQIQDYEDESTDNEMKFVYILKRGADPNYVRDVIYKHTDLEQTCRVNFEVLDGITPMRMSYKSYLLSFIEFRKLTKFRLYCNKLQAIQTKIHEREIYIKVLQSGEIDNIINMIKNQSNIDDTYLIEYLIKKLKITDLQAKFILGTDIRKLSKGYLKKYIEEAKELELAKQDCLRRITDDNLIIEDIKQELLEYKKLYGRKRRCKVITESEASDIPQGEFKIVVTQNNFIKKVQLTDSIGNSKNDNPKCVLKAENTENILIFDEMGKVFKLPVSKVMFTDRGSNGTDIRLMIKNLTSNINTIMYEPTVKDFSIKTTKHFIVVVTAQGNIKKMDLDDFLTVPPSGILYIKLDNGDYVKDIMITNDMNDIIVYSHSKALRMSVKDIPYLKRSTKGSRAMNTAEPIDGISIIKSNTTDIIVVTEKGYINRFHPAALPCMGRGKAGNRVIKLSKGDSIKAIYGLNQDDSFMVITKNDKIEFKVSDIPEGSSISAGTKMINTKTDMIVDIKILKKN